MFIVHYWVDAVTKKEWKEKPRQVLEGKLGMHKILRLDLQHNN